MITIAITNKNNNNIISNNLCEHSIIIVTIEYLHSLKNKFQSNIFPARPAESLEQISLCLYLTVVVNNRKPSPVLCNCLSLQLYWQYNLMDVYVDIFQWLYLSNVFAEPEIRRSLGDSNQKFIDVDEKYRVSFFLIVIQLYCTEYEIKHYASTCLDPGRSGDAQECQSCRREDLSVKKQTILHKIGSDAEQLVGELCSIRNEEN